MFTEKHFWLVGKPTVNWLCSLYTSLKWSTNESFKQQQCHGSQSTHSVVSSHNQNIFRTMKTVFILMDLFLFGKFCISIEATNSQAQRYIFMAVMMPQLINSTLFNEADTGDPLFDVFSTQCPLPSHTTSLVIQLAPGALQSIWGKVGNPLLGLLLLNCAATTAIKHNNVKNCSFTIFSTANDKTFSFHFVFFTFEHLG